MNRSVRNGRRRSRGGFTLMEVLLVLAILVIIGSLAFISFPKLFGSAQADSAKAQILGFKTPINTFRLHMGRLPANLQELVTDPGDKPGKWQGPYLDPPQVPLDPWDKEYQFATPSTHGNTDYDVWTTDPEGKEIGNWTEQ